MKRFALLFLLALLPVTQPACRTVGTPALERISREVDCLKDRLPTQAVAYLDVVNSCLVGMNFMSCLTQLSEQAGRDVVACAVAQVGAEAKVRAASAGPGVLVNQDVIAGHAAEYLQADGATVVRR